MVLDGDGWVYQEDRGCVCVADVGVATVAGEPLETVAAGDVQDFKGSALEDKVRDVVGLYLDPPEGEVVVSVHAKSGIQALDRTQPLLPIDFGKAQKRTFDYARMGTTDLYAAMDIRTGKVITSLSRTHATPDLWLMKKVVAAHPGQKIHVVLDNASVHLSVDTEKWLAKAERESRLSLHPYRCVVDESD